MSKVPCEHVKKLESRRKRKVSRTKELKTKLKKRRIEGTKGADEDYGANAQRPDMNEDAYKEQLILHNNRLREWQEERKEIEEGTRGQTQSDLWMNIRRKILTSSNFGKVCRMRESTLCTKIVKNILYPQLLSVPAIEYGRQCEETAREQLQRQIGENITKCGLFIDEEIPYFGASPDGVIDEDTIVEIKCPFSIKNLSLEEAIQGKIGQVHKIFDKSNLEQINKKHVYYYQIQGQLHITGRKVCLFCVWTQKDMKCIKVYKDDLFWETKMLPKLNRFYLNCLLPEIIDSRYNRHMPIREPAYILEARKKVHNS